jgi:hypothetical protein
VNSNGIILIVTLITHAMALKTYSGSCNCGAVQYEAEIDLTKGSGRCNCTFDRKVRSWTTFVPAGTVHIISGEDNLTEYHKHQEAGHKFFCKTCGIYIYGKGNAEYMGGPYEAIYISSLDTATPEELAAIPVRYADGLNNNWTETPTITSYL